MEDELRHYVKKNSQDEVAKKAAARIKKWHQWLKQLKTLTEGSGKRGRANEENDLI
jgi:hypothetical protein